MKRYPLGLACAVIVAGGVPALASGSGISRALPAPAVPGDLDVTFSGDGRQITDFGGSDGATAVAVQADGKIVVAGSSAGDFALARYGADGTPDASFSGDGFVTTDLGGTDGGQDVAVQADGKIVVAGSSGGNFALARYSAGGVLDTSFSGDGLQTTDFGAADGGTAMAVQADGRIVVGGNSGGNFALARYDANGGLDTSFSGDGKQTTDFGGFDSSNDVAIGADGAIVAVGTHAFGDLRAANFALARYSAGGALVSVQTTDFGHSQSTYDSGEGVAIQADGHIVVVGYGQEQDQFGGYYPRDLQLARYDVSGALDSTFSDDGRLATSFGADSLGYGVALEGNGRIVAIGKAAGAFTLARFNTDGTLDATFSDDGKQTSDAALAGADEVGVDGVLQADGKLVTVGTAAGAGGTDFVLARFHGDAPDPDPPGPNTPETRITGGPSGPTNVTAPSYRFTATLAGSTFECKVDGPGAAMGTYTSCASPKAYGTLTDGRYTFSVRATRSGITDPTPATRPFTVDTIGPGLIFDSVPSPYTNNPFARLEFHSTEPNSTFVCRFDMVEIPSYDVGPCVSPRTYGPLGGVAMYYVFVFVTDAAGNETGYWLSGSWTVDQSPPSAAILSGPSGTTQATTASFEFISSEDGTFECKLDGPGTATGTYASCASPKTYSGLGAGAYTFSMRSIDLAGNGSSPETRSFTVAPNPTPSPSPSPSPASCVATNGADVAIPDLSTVESAIAVSGCAGSASASATVEAHIVHTYIGDLLVTLVAPDGSAYVLHNRAGGSTDNIDQTYTVNLSSEPANGTWRLRVQDAAAADVGRIDSWTINLGAGPAPTPSPTPTPRVPDTTITGGPTGPTNGTAPSFAFTATVANSTFACKLDTPAGAGSYAPCTSPRTYTTTTNGAYTFSVRATSADGTDATPPSRLFTVDTVAPETSLDSGPVGSTTDATPRFTFSSNEPGSFECRLDTVETPGFFEPCSSPLNLGPLAGGVEYAVFVRAIDAAGNADPTWANSGLFVVDGSPPDTWIDDGPTGVTGVTTPVFAFHATLGGSTFECKLDTPAGPGAYTACTSPRQYTTTVNGPYTLTVRATSNGRTDQSPATRSFTVATTPSSAGCAATNGTDVPIADLSTVESPITIPGCARNASATATVEAHIVHTYIGDLLVTLIAPDGSAYVLHNRAGGSTDNIDQTYTVNLSSEPANGTWRLRVQDAAAADVGRIDAWTITL